jgi:transcription initiation factor IIF auxiliary subunit
MLSIIMMVRRWKKVKSKLRPSAALRFTQETRQKIVFKASLLQSAVEPCHIFVEFLAKTQLLTDFKMSVKKHIDKVTETQQMYKGHKTAMELRLAHLADVVWP